MKPSFGLKLVLLFAALAVPSTHAAERYPTKPVRLIVPYPPGGGSDITGRAIGVKLNEYLGQTFVIDNRPGATGLIGTQLAARAPADGYTLLLADAPHTINALVYSKPPYDAIKDFASFQWYGVFAPAATPREINRALNSPDIKERFVSLTLDPMPGKPEAFLRRQESI